MQRKSIFQFYCFLFFLGLASAAQRDTSVTPFKKFFVRIVNNLDAKKLDFECKSQEDVIARSLAARGDEFEFGFRLDIQLSTYYFCDLWYLNYHVGFHAFQVDEQLLDLCGGVHCIWQAQEDGIYLYNIQRGNWLRKYSWEKMGK
ncbi:hypothetical protein PRUPE_1G219700 [Prunus persica]|uniref:S-protein homolog n=1 Tax=Prunus persica TaxID=3760 RepID=A0A251R4C0_PRUPE|nr:uncharacterized protein LOC18790752 [Prunus persica]ONI29885.1 hypothetical protein PRUPE_1G219700 [Prunus persica]